MSHRKLQNAVDKKEAALADKDAALADKDAVLADKDVMIEDLYKRLQNEEISLNKTIFTILKWIKWSIALCYIKFKAPKKTGGFVHWSSNFP